MDVEFYSDDPRRKSRSKLDEILSNGVDQLAIACAFCTRAGIEVLLRHTSKLRMENSFVVVAANPPTDYERLEELHNQIPGHLFVHWGFLLPVEKKHGAALMHSKVFFARAGEECWLWTGSHNLTGNATQGANCEAAVILHGTVDEQPFVDALQHLNACREESTLYDVETMPPDDTKPAVLIAIHAETPEIPSARLPWSIHLCLESPDFDDFLGPPSVVRLFLYADGALIHGWQAATPIAAFSGSLTGQNLTELNPGARGAGAPASWDLATFGIEESRGVLVLCPAKPPGPRVTTQVHLNIDSESEVDESLFSKKPRLEIRRKAGEICLTDADPDMRRFFTRDSFEGANLVHVPYVGREIVVSASNEDSRNRDIERYREKLASSYDMPLQIMAPSGKSRERRHPCIVQVRYRLDQE